jgi:hypothetical protein
MNAKQIASASTAELLAFFNANSAKKVARFADKATAQKRVAALVATLPAPKKAAKAAAAPKAERNSRKDQNACPACGSTADQTPAGPEGTAAAERNFCHHCSTEYSPSTGKIYKAPAVSADRAMSIAKSWMDKAVAVARAERTSVRVSVPAIGSEPAYKAEFKSVAEAFRKLGLPMSKHIKFRMELKAAGKAAFGIYKFTAL